MVARLPHPSNVKRLAVQRWNGETWTTIASGLRTYEDARRV